MRYVHRFLYRLLVAVAFLLAPFSRKLYRGLQGRRGLVERVRTARAAWKAAPIWFHVSSSGELEQCLPVLETLRSRVPETPIFVSVFSPSGWRALELEVARRKLSGNPIPWDHADYSPFDFPNSVGEFLEALKPACFVAIHREIWPGLLDGCSRRGIPAFLFAAYFPPHGRRWFSFYRPFAERFRYIGTVEANSAAFLKTVLPHVTVETVGDPRAERVLRRRHMSRPAAWAEYFRGQRVWIGASLWEADFKRLAPALEAVLRTHEQWRLILVPHEPEGAVARRIERWFESREKPIARWSQYIASPESYPRGTHLLVDRVGLLAELYAIADLVFVGGSFRTRVHNVLEPAAYGRPILTGPYIQNSREAREMAEGKVALQTADTSAELAQALLRLIEDEPWRRQASQAALDYLMQRQGAAAVYAERLLANLDPATSG
jgi:3-deoxy-D-manno-octulosonic-acid transferase